MSKYPNLTQADSLIMEILWREGAMGSADILRQVEDELNWSRQTVRTYLQRLIDKGLVGVRTTRKRVYAYYPLVSREEYAADKAGSLMNRYYGKLSHMVAGLAKSQDISDQDLDELEALIRNLRGKGKQ